MLDAVTSTLGRRVDGFNLTQLENIMLNIDINNTVANLPEQARTTVLYSLIGSLNTRLIGGAQRIVTNCDKNGEELHAEINEGFPCTSHEAAAMAELGTGYNWFAVLHDINALRLHLRMQLAQTINQTEEDVLPLAGTLKFMTEGDIKLLPKEMIEELVNALGIDGLDVATVQEVDRLDKTMRRAQLFAMRDRVLDVVLQLPGDEPDEHAFDHLPHEIAVRILEKMRSALNKARNDAVLAFVRRSSRADIGDIPLIQAAIKEVDAVLKEARDIDPLVHEHVAANVVKPPKKASGKKRQVTVDQADLAAAYHPA